MVTLIEIARLSPEEPVFAWNIEHPRGKQRLVAKPNEAMRALHRRLVARLRSASMRHPFCYSFNHSYGGLRGRGTLANASAHSSSQYFYQFDIASAFSSIRMERLANVLVKIDKTLGTEAEVTTFLQRYCSAPSGGLAVGGPASPALFDMYCAYLIDTPINHLLWKHQLWSFANVYTRYVDDVTLSSNRPIPRILRKRIRTIVASAGLSIRHDKSVVRDRTERPVLITGVVITSDGRLRPPQAFIESVAKALRQPVVTKKQVYRFTGLVQYLASFLDAGLDDDLQRLLARCHKRIATLEKNGLLVKQKTSSRLLNKEFIEAVRKAVFLPDLVGKYIKLKRSGREWVGLSPFTNEKTPSFTVVPQKGFWHDFSSGKHGDAFTLLMELERITFRQAVLRLAQEYGVPLQYQLKY